MYKTLLLHSASLTVSHAWLGSVLMRAFVALSPLAATCLCQALSARLQREQQG